MSNIAVSTLAMKAAEIGTGNLQESQQFDSGQQFDGPRSKSKGQDHRSWLEPRTMPRRTDLPIIGERSINGFPVIEERSYALAYEGASRLPLSARSASSLAAARV